MPSSPLHRICITTIQSFFLLLCIAGLAVTSTACEEGNAPDAEPAIDAKARQFLQTLTTRNLPEIRKPLSETGKLKVDNISMASIFGYFESGLPHSVTLIDAEMAISNEPTYAERHRLTYSLICTDDNLYYYFFEATIEHGDTLISGFMIEPRKK